VHAGQLLGYLRSMDAPRPNLWDQDFVARPDPSVVFWLFSVSPSSTPNSKKRNMIRRSFALLLLALPLACSSSTAPPAVLLVENFNAENGGVYALNYAGFTNWDVTTGSVDLVGTPPYDDFLPHTQGMYVDLDGSSGAAGLLRSKASFDLPPGTYRLEFKMAGTPRDNQPANTVNVSVGEFFHETITLESYAPLSTYVRTFKVRSRGTAHLQFEQLGGDNYGNFIDDIRFERL